MTHSGQALPRLAAVSDTASLDPARLLPPVLGADDSDTPADIVDALALAPFTAGTQPYASTTRLSEVRPEAPLLPPDATVLRRAAEPDRDACLAAGDGLRARPGDAVQRARLPHGRRDRLRRRRRGHAAVAAALA
ncbi:MAG TPA: DUF5925 domain-containing protein [Streptosporangiaceae bacterium]|nr:DUF5925 domain-containing protein [Streptosporangiaceae bacterium]